MVVELNVLKIQLLLVLDVVPCSRKKNTLDIHTQPKLRYGYDFRTPPKKRYADQTFEVSGHLDLDV